TAALAGPGDISGSTSSVGAGPRAVRPPAAELQSDGAVAGLSAGAEPAGGSGAGPAADIRAGVAAGVRASVSADRANLALTARPGTDHGNAAGAADLARGRPGAAPAAQPVAAAGNGDLAGARQDQRAKQDAHDQGGRVGPVRLADHPGQG